MADRVEVRYHETLGYAVRWPGEDVWWVKLGRAEGTPQRLADHAVRGKGWRELELREVGEDVLHIVDGGGRLQQTILDPACAEPADDRCRNCGRTQAHCDRRTIKFCCSACDHPVAVSHDPT